MERTCELEGHYRYLLRIPVNETPKSVLFVLCNPSTADSTKDDTTTRNLQKWAKQNSVGQAVIVNLYAYRASQHAGLASLSEAEAVGEKNMDAIARAAAECDEVLVAWGNPPKCRSAAEVERRVQNVIAAILKVHDFIYCLGTTAAGNPRHPRVWYMTETPPKTVFAKKNDQPPQRLAVC